METTKAYAFRALARGSAHRPQCQSLRSQALHSQNHIFENLQHLSSLRHQTTNDILYLLFLHTRFTYFVHLSTATSSFSLFFSLIQNWNSQSTQYKSVRCTFSQVNCLPRTQAIHVGTKRQMWSWHQWTLEWEQLKTVKPLKPLILFLKELNTPRHWQVSNRSTKSCEGIQVAGNSVVMSCTLQNRTQVFWLLVVFVMSSPDVSKEVASVAASEPPRPRAASVQATLQKDIAFKACCGDSSSSVHKSGRPTAGLLLEKERKTERIIDLSDLCDLQLDSNIEYDDKHEGSEATTCIEPARLEVFQSKTRKHFKFWAWMCLSWNGSQRPFDNLWFSKLQIDQQIVQIVQNQRICSKPQSSGFRFLEGPHCTSMRMRKSLEIIDSNLSSGHVSARKPCADEQPRQGTWKHSRI